MSIIDNNLDEVIEVSSIQTTGPYIVKEVEHVWITLPDGCKLSAKLWIPTDSNGDCVKSPGILEYLPYRKRDWSRCRDAERHGWTCTHGYAIIRADMRGSGDSDGLYFDEYEKQEQDDACCVIDWISSQEWCTGDVGMYGKSWGGFNGLQVSSRNPPALKAVISLYMTDDRYATDVHYMGGCIIGSEMLSWSSVMHGWNARPPDISNCHENWFEKWKYRLENASSPWIEKWLDEQTRDDYWKHGSVCEEIENIKCPVYLIGGWMDLYTNTVFRLAKTLKAPFKALIGPWSHEWPDSAFPGPRISFLQECKSWWDCHLKKINNNIMDEPIFRVYIRESILASPHVNYWPGRWVAENKWPCLDADRFEEMTMSLFHDNLISKINLEKETIKPLIRYGKSTMECGSKCGAFLSFGQPDFPLDQRIDDSLSLCWTSDILLENICIFGFPKVKLHLNVDQPQASIAIRLCDVHPLGESSLITKGFLNLSHRNGHSREELKMMKPGEMTTIEVILDATAYEVPKNHCIRLAVSTSYWPTIWPSPSIVTVGIECGRDTSELVLPIRKETLNTLETDKQLRNFGKPDLFHPYKFEYLRKPTYSRKFEYDQVEKVSKLIVESYDGKLKLPDCGIIMEEEGKMEYTIKEGDPLSARASCTRKIEYKYDTENMDEESQKLKLWNPRIFHNGVMTANDKNFGLNHTLNVKNGNEVVYENKWNKNISREFQ